MKSITYKDVTYDEEKLKQMTLGQMASVYNEVAPKLGLKPVAKFADRDAATRRLGTALNDYMKNNSPVVKEKKVTEEKPAAKERRVRQKRFVFPVKDKIQAVRDPDCLRQKLIDGLTGKGATFEEMEEITREFDRQRGKQPFNIERRTYEGMRLLHFYVGYGMRHDMVTGLITLVEPK